MSKFFFYSLTLHVIVGFVTWLDLPAFWRKQPVITEIPIMVDLSDVVISGITNLPAESEEETESELEVESEPEEPEYTAVVPEEQPPEIEFEPVVVPTEIKSEEEAPELEFEEVKPEVVSLVEKKEEPKKKPKPKRVAVRPPPPSRRPAPPQEEKPKKPKKKKEVNPLESLLASVDGMKKNFKKRTPDAVGTSNKRTGGIKGGTGGTFGRDLTISEKDAIASSIKQCWNLDAGDRDIENMLIEIRVHLMPDGTVKKVQILDKALYKSDAHFKSVAESARRAVYICSPFEVPLGKYETWKTMLLRFNPMDGGVS